MIKIIQSTVHTTQEICHFKTHLFQPARYIDARTQQFYIVLDFQSCTYTIILSTFQFTFPLTNFWSGNLHVIHNMFGHNFEWSSIFTFYGPLHDENFIYTIILVLTITTLLWKAHFTAMYCTKSQYLCLFLFFHLQFKFQIFLHKLFLSLAMYKKITYYFENLLYSLAYVRYFYEKLA